MRDIKTLLELLLFKTIETNPMYFTGMCRGVISLCSNLFITNKECDKLLLYLRKNKPEDAYDESYWWRAGLKEPRIDWIKEHIKFLDYENN